MNIRYKIDLFVLIFQNILELVRKSGRKDNSEIDSVNKNKLMNAFHYIHCIIWLAWPLPYQEKGPSSFLLQ